MNKVLIVGAAGFVGGYLTSQLLASGIWEVHATKLPTEELYSTEQVIHELDILNFNAVCALLEKVQPSVIFHLAAQSSVGLSWKKPQMTVEININGTINVLEAVKAVSPSSRVLLIGSSEEYGPVEPNQVPVKEDTPANPQSVYAVTKNTQNQLGRLYAKAYGLDIISTRSFNHTGPKQIPGFVVPDFSKQIAQIEKGCIEPVIKVGNLAAKRDFTDVRDIVRAYELLALKGNSGVTYNVGSGNAVSIQTLLDSLLVLSKAEVKVEVDPARFMPIDVPVVVASIQKLQADTGWVPEIALDTTLKDTLDYWRCKITTEG